MRWLLTFLLACLLFNALHRWLNKIGLGRLPGDFHFRWLGREWFLPFTTALVVTMLGGLIGLII